MTVHVNQKKIRAWEDNFDDLEHVFDKLNWISNINDVKLGMDIFSEGFDEILSNYDIMFF